MSFVGEDESRENTGAGDCQAARGAAHSGEITADLQPEIDEAPYSHLKRP
jgi:hypothetical protein